MDAPLVSCLTKQLTCCLSQVLRPVKTVEYSTEDANFVDLSLTTCYVGGIHHYGFSVLRSVKSEVYTSLDTFSLVFLN